MTDVHEDFEYSKETLLEEIEILAADVIDQHDVKVMKNHLDLLTEEEKEQMSPQELEREQMLKKYQAGNENWEKFEEYLKQIFSRRDN